MFYIYHKNRTPYLSLSIEIFLFEIALKLLSKNRTLICPLEFEEREHKTNFHFLIEQVLKKLTIYVTTISTKVKF